MYFNTYLFNFSAGCAPGTYIYLATEECIDCVKGFYAEDEYSSSCTACPPGMSTAETASSSLADCIGMLYVIHLYVYRKLPFSSNVNYVQNILYHLGLYDKLQFPYKQNVNICMPPRRRVGGHIKLPLSIRPSGYRYMVCPANSTYSFRATALIFSRMFIHIMEVCMSTGF